MKNLLSTLILVTSLNAFGLDLQVSNPATLKLKIYKVAFSTSEFCTNLQTVFEDADPTYKDFLTNPTIAEGASLADGTYKCVVIEFSDFLKFTTTTADGSCAANTEYNLDVCRGTAYTLINGTTGTCASASGNEDRIAMYLSTTSTETNGTNGHSAFQAPTSTSDSAHGFKLLSAFVKAGSATKRFVVDGTGKVSGTGSCDMQPPSFTFVD